MERQPTDGIFGLKGDRLYGCQCYYGPPDKVHVHVLGQVVEILGVTLMGREQAGPEKADIQKSTVSEAVSNSPAPVSCVPTCPVRELAPEIVEYLEDLHDAHSDFLFANELAKKLRAALAAPCLGQPATDFDRAEFDVLLNEVVALREWKAAQERVLSARPRIVCLCGSSRFVPEMACIAWALERDEGYIVLSLHLLPADYPGVQPDHQAEAEGVATKMDELHLRKIDLADEVLVVNIDGYIGESTRREITYATAQKKVVRYLEPVEAKRGAPPPEGQG